MTSKPPAACCSTGYEHSGTTTGTLIQIPDTTISAYLATPPSSGAATGTSPKPKDHAILFIPDILGMHKNNLLLADRFASAGYLTLVVDIYNGDPFPLHKPFADLEPTDDHTRDWAAKGSDGKNPHTIAEIDPIVRSAIAYLRSEHHGITRIGAVGYCVGVKYVVRFLDAGKGKIDVGFGAHPSYVTEQELWDMRGPLSIAAAGERDLIFTNELRHQTEEILRKKGEVWSIALYSGVAHGFAVRGNPEGKEDRWAMDEAFVQAVRFFGTWL
ncbi:dienelactone hydrolase [Echria macrotheca]|uniref:Dienelactone hydrolase n=1 Tax=Echria macrotheca TaxID=438768 RepID=A0AAJ0B2Y7_9PEZI|nr:dienelactone hydrolase [Echria macrotheca]